MRSASPSARRSPPRQSRNKVDLAARGLTADALADLLLDGLEGMKSRVATADGQREGARRLVAVIALALQR